ncbi:HET-domain-containing protein [Thozetella sp. PMI_491]|nr:HET-domain-containing protein [Thozetella sp. PMI_491]
MRLINARTLEIEEFPGTDIPSYAILSHTWGDREAGFDQWTRRWTRVPRLRRPGFSKVAMTCKQARRDDIPYVWVDTVCIDKSSSAELSEAINSMFAWYQKAKICYVYLSDVHHPSAGGASIVESLRTSRWFTRGWTLQELIAPRNLIFYSKEWKPLGTKSTMAVQLAGITGIDYRCLKKDRRLDEYSIAQRMAWAAKRLTTREEDLAYSMLGIFNINMPLLYGEGAHKAFRRLQEEIIKVSDDHSILTFDTNLSNETLFAHHPSTFTTGHKIHTNFTRKITSPFSMTNAGLSMTTPLIQTLSPFWVLALLNCVEVDIDKNTKRSQICLPLFGKDCKYMRARSPVCLVSKPLDEAILDLRDEIPDLTTQMESTYLISNFSKIYSAYGTEMDTALKGFEIEPAPAAGFMITFPRGLANFKLEEAYPAASLRSEISFFTPSDATFSSTPGGLLIFRKRDTARYIAVYLGLELDSTNKILEDWVCHLVWLEEGEYEPGYAKRTAAKLQKQHEAGELGSSRKHYHHVGDAAVAARARFPTLTGGPCNEAIMAELVFDAQSLLAEWESLDFIT